MRRCPRDERKLWPKAQVRPIRWHDLRHTTASLLKAAGVHLVDAQRILRHSDPRITQEVYTHVDLDQLHSAVNGMAVRIDNFPVDGNVDGGDGRNGGRKSVTTTEFSKSGKDLNPVEG
jgi:Phage integrase family